MSTLPSHPSEDLLYWRPTYPSPGMRVGSSFQVLPEIFFSGKENVSEFLDSIDFGVIFHEIPAKLACAYLKGHLIGKARDWFEVIGSSERDEGVVETDRLNGEGSRVESEYSKGLANEESSKEGQWRGRRVRSKGLTESSNNKERRHRNERRPPRRLNWRERSVSSSLGPGTRKMTWREAVDESGRQIKDLDTFLTGGESSDIKQRGIL
ncbi:hypothetical protein NPIL_484671 [Nephila pilipes]|uniref:Uncharacterized protein n=1 Tax=Nephila pilipes TaxID=299642 RepID=A0A8X6PPX3_NEPPI|nr:hypothetical protein NPIL_484671 [Nephila pilipes]